MLYWNGNGQYQNEWDALRAILFVGSVQEIRSSTQGRIALAANALTNEYARNGNINWHDGDEPRYLRFVNDLEDDLVEYDSDEDETDTDCLLWDVQVNEQIKKDLGRIHLLGELWGPNLRHLERNRVSDEIQKLIFPESDGNGGDCFDRIIDRVVEYCKKYPKCEKYPKDDAAVLDLSNVFDL